MGFNLKIGGYPFQLTNYSVDEQASPLSAGDSFGSTGTINLTLVRPDKYVTPAPGTGWDKVNMFGPNWLIDKSVVFTDGTKGTIVGSVESVNPNDNDATISLTCNTRLDELNVYGVQAQPYVGTLGGAFTYYLSLAGITAGFSIDTQVANRYVVFQGWTGELWFHLKEMGVAQDCDISLVDGVILLRPIRTRVATPGRDTERSTQTGGGPLARAVEVYRYGSRPISNELVWPPGGWKAETEEQNVNAGEDAEYVLELSASVSTIQPPVMVDNVSPDYAASSVYTIIANDGLRVPKAAWEANGGKVQVLIEPDTKSLRVKLHGARGLVTASGALATNFRLALASDTTSNNYSTLRIVGTGVAYEKEKITVRTTVPENKTATEIGVTVDNIFLNTVDEAYRAGIRAALAYSGYQPTLSGTVTALNGLGENGQEDFQVFGNVQGCRVWDSKSKRFYRIRQGTSTPGFVQGFQADDDLTCADAEQADGDKTYGEIQEAWGDLTYKEIFMAGLYG